MLSLDSALGKKHISYTFSNALHTRRATKEFKQIPYLHPTTVPELNEGPIVLLRTQKNLKHPQPPNRSPTHLFPGSSSHPYLAQAASSPLELPIKPSSGNSDLGGTGGGRRTSWHGDTTHGTDCHVDQLGWCQGGVNGAAYMWHRWSV